MRKRLDVTQAKGHAVVAFNIIGFAEGYLLREMGLQWLVPVILATAFGAVLLSRALPMITEADELTGSRRVASFQGLVTLLLLSKWGYRIHAGERDELF